MEPTGFGSSRKIVHGFLPQDGTESRPALFIRDDSMAVLTETLDWNNGPQPQDRAYPCSNRTASDLVRTSADTPLDEYLAQYPESLARLVEKQL